jgi:hypothetical protein
MLINLRSELTGEDSSYTICTVKLPETADLTQFFTTVKRLYNESEKESGCLRGYHDDDAFIKLLQENGFKIVKSPLEIVIRQ